jgi:HSP20 family molecular chaperone IbpA
MNEDKKKSNKNIEDEDIGIDIGANVDGVFGKIIKGLGDLTDKLEQAGGEIHKEGRFSTNSSKPKKGAWGFSVRSMNSAVKTNKSDDIKPFKTTHYTNKNDMKGDHRDPLVDVFIENDSVVVVFELPGVAVDEIIWTIDKNTLILNTNGKIKYTKEVKLPDDVISDSCEKTYNNGILQLVIQRK